MKAIILAGGTGSRLNPATKSICKQLLPVYDKPAIYYPFSLCLLSGISEILIISTPDSVPALEKLLGDGSNYGCSIQYKVQYRPDGIARALIIGEEFLNGDPCMLLLGDNILIKSGFTNFITPLITQHSGARIFGFPVKQPEQFGVIEYDSQTKAVLSLEEKPYKPKSNLAAVGLYLYDGSASERAKSLKESARGELEITDLNISYLKDGLLSCSTFSRGDFWGDIGTFEALNECSNYVRLHQEYTGMLISSPEEAAYRLGRIDREEFINLISPLPKNSYSKLLRDILEHDS